jgi:hypothetical protein
MVSYMSLVIAENHKQHTSYMALLRPGTMKAGVASVTDVPIDRVSLKQSRSV